MFKDIPVYFNYQFSDSQSDQSQPSDDGSVQSKENDEEERALTSNGMPSRMPVSNDFSNGYDERFNDTCSSSTFEGGSEHYFKLCIYFAYYFACIALIIIYLYHSSASRHCILITVSPCEFLVIKTWQPF